MKRLLGGFLIATAIFLPSAAGAGDKGVTVETPWSRATVGKTGAVYMTLRNDGTETDVVVGVESGAARKAEIHETIAAGDIMKMRPVDRLELAPGETVVLEPGGKHIMLMGLAGPLKEGEDVSLTLTFETAGTVDVVAPVAAAGAAVAPAHGMDHGSHQ